MTAAGLTDLNCLWSDIHNVRRLVEITSMDEVQKVGILEFLAGMERDADGAKAGVATIIAALGAVELDDNGYCTACGRYNYATSGEHTTDCTTAAALTLAGVPLQMRPAHP